jgi:hypothetical protein
LAGKEKQVMDNEQRILYLQARFDTEPKFKALWSKIAKHALGSPKKPFDLYPFPSEFGKDHAQERHNRSYAWWLTRQRKSNSTR